METLQDNDIEDRTRRYFGDFYKILASHSVLVIGAGAVGTEVIKNLVMLGIKSLHLVDFDKVSLSNLNRCIFFKPEDHEKVYKVDAIARELRHSWPSLDLKTYPVSIQEAPEEVWNVPLVILAVDNNEARYYTNLRLLSQETFLINGAMGRTFIEAEVLLPGETACLLCTWSQEYIHALFHKMVKENCDQFFQKSSERFPAISVLNSILGGIMAGEAAKILIGLSRWKAEKKWEEDHVPFLGNRLRYDLSSQEFSMGKLTKNPHCVEIFCRLKCRSKNS
ncbi:MAG: ThiF family adenylyltransferase [Candidatus Brocadiae bacterium]|nr:ThiF family adenylyltransferase [Candidatus Brocadiia bacterium]